MIAQLKLLTPIDLLCDDLPELFLALKRFKEHGFYIESRL